MQPKAANHNTPDGRLGSGIQRGEAIHIHIDGRRVSAFDGETIGTVLTALGLRTIRHTPRDKDPRGLYCCMGTCQGCLVTVDGVPNIRACVTPIAAGQKIVLQDGFGRHDPERPLPPRAKRVHQQVPVVVVGAGPAGLSAALAAAGQGARVLVIDENALPGGQIYRQMPAPFEAFQPSLLGRDHADGQALLKQVARCSDRITIWNDARVWSVFAPRQLAVARGNELLKLDADAIVVATGAYERPLPVPGWTLPGVMTAGGAQLMIKSQRIRPGQRVLLAGSGPLQLVVAHQLLAAGCTVVAVAEAVSTAGAWRHLPGLLRQPGLLARGLKYNVDLKRAGVKMLSRHVLQAVEGRDQARGAVLTAVDARLQPIPGRQRRFEVDTVCIGYGLIPAIWLTRMLGCGHRYDPLVGGWVPNFDPAMRPDQAGVFVAGDGAGIAGVLAARGQGTIAGLQAAAHAGVVTKTRSRKAARATVRYLRALYRFRHAMDRIYALGPDIYAQMPDETIVCRCEGVTAGDVRRAVRQGTPDLGDIKRRTRAGMGPCQGLNCMPAIAALLVNEFGAQPGQIRLSTTRPPARPLDLNLLMVDA